MIYLREKDYQDIVAYCKECLPYEACGLIGGTVREGDRYIKKVYYLTNEDRSSTHFSMNPKEQLEAVKDMRMHGYELLGNFHSHPSSYPRPSEEDIRFAYDSSMAYLILSLIKAEHPSLKAYMVQEEKKAIAVQFVAISII